MRVPDPKANTTTEAYLAYKAGYLEESELKPKLYKPDWHFDGWLAYWAGLTSDYPMKKSKNIFNSPDTASAVFRSTYEKVDSNSFIATSTATTQQGTVYVQINASLSPDTSYTINYNSMVVSGEPPSVAGSLSVKIGSALAELPKKGKRTFVTDSSGDVRFYFYLNFAESGGAIAVGDAVKFYDIQLEQGREATEFEEYSNAPEMLCDEEALVAYLSGVTDTYPEEIKDPYDVRIVGYLKHLASVRWPEPDYPVNNEEFYLSTMEPTHTSNPEPSSNIELDTAEGKIISVEAYGDTYQQTYSGKNMLDIDFTTATKQGITFTNNGDSTITISGTPQAASDFPISPSAISLPITLTSGKNYTQRLEIISGSLGGMSLVPAFKNSQGTISYNYFTNNSTRTPSETLTCHSYNLFWGPATVGTAINVTIRVWLEEGSDTSSSFEPYTGGIPAPNPDYPQDIRVVTGEQTINVRGVNMFNVNKPLENKYLDNSGGWTTSTYSYVNQEYIVTGSSELSFSFAEKHGTPTIRVGEFKADGTFIKRTLVSTALTLTLDALTNKIIFSVDNLSPNYFDGLQIELGSSPTSYQPYTSQSYTVDLGSIELCKIGDYQDYIYKSGDDWYIHKETNAKAIDGTEVGWGKSGTTSNNAYYLSTSIFNDINKDGMGVGQLDTHITPTFSRYFIATSSKNIFTTDTIGLGFNAQQSPSTNIDLRIGTGLASSLDTLQLFKDWLGANRPTIYYVLATATDTKITDATLIEQLESLAGADTYNEKTYIKVTANDPNLPALLKVEAYKY